MLSPSVASSWSSSSAAASARRRPRPAVVSSRPCPRRPPLAAAAAALAALAPLAGGSAADEADAANANAAAPPARPAPERFVPGAVLEIDGPADYAAVRAHLPGRLVVLMCKARSCRPCKAFSRKYGALAARFSEETAFLEIYGDGSRESRQMMISLAVRVTPTFRLSRGAQEVAVLTGTSDAKLRDAVVEALTEEERAAHPDEVAAWARSREAAAEVAALEAATQERAAAAMASLSGTSSADEA